MLPPFSGCRNRLREVKKFNQAHTVMDLGSEHSMISNDLLPTPNFVLKTCRKVERIIHTHTHPPFPQVQQV